MNIIWIVGFDTAQASGVVSIAFDTIPFTIITWPTGSIWMDRI